MMLNRSSTEIKCTQPLKLYINCVMKLQILNKKLTFNRKLMLYIEILLNRSCHKVD